MKEQFYATADYLASGKTAAWQQIGSFVKSGQLSLGPGDMVFEEAESTLISAAGEPVTAW